MMKYTIKKLSALDVLNCIESAKEVHQSLNIDSESNQLAHALSEHATLAYYCLYDGDNQVFSCPLDVLKTLSINELCDVYDEYFNIYQSSDCELEIGTNESFDLQLKGGEF